MYRWFKPGDVDMIEEDMEDLRALFHAEGDGLEVAEVQQMCMGVQDLLTVLQLETEILIDNLKQVSLIIRYLADKDSLHSAAMLSTVNCLQGDQSIPS